MAEAMGVNLEVGNRYEVHRRMIDTFSKEPKTDIDVMTVRNIEQRDGFLYVGFDVNLHNGRGAGWWGYMRVFNEPQEWGVQKITEWKGGCRDDQGAIR